MNEFTLKRIINLTGFTVPAKKKTEHYWHFFGKFQSEVNSKTNIILLYDFMSKN